MFRSRNSGHWSSWSYWSWGAQFRAIAVALLVLLTLSGIFSTFTVHAKGSATNPHEPMAVSQLPAQGQAMKTLI